MTPALEQTVYADFVISNSTGAAADADSTPSAEVFEDANDTAILSPTVAKRTSKTGNYRVTLPCTAANGFEEGKSYNVIASATVGGIAAKAVIATFQIRTRYDANVTYFGGSAGTFSGGRPEVNTTHWKGQALATVDTNGYPVVTIKDGTGAGELDLTSGKVLPVDIDGLGFANAMRAVIGIVGGRSTFNTVTKVGTFHARDGTTVVGTITYGAGGVRDNSIIT